MKTTSNSMIIQAHEGDAFWQPGVKGNCITIKISPWNHAETNHTVFLHELPKGGEVGEHAHDDGTEIFICLDGEGIMTIDGKDHSFKQHDVAYVATNSWHRIQATSEIPLKFMVMAPAGLEERLKLMGQPKISIDEAPPEAFDSEIGRQSTHGVI